MDLNRKLRLARPGTAAENRLTFSQLLSPYDSIPYNNLPGHLPGVATPGSDKTPDPVRPRGLVDLVHKKAHLHISPFL